MATRRRKQSDPIQRDQHWFRLPVGADSFDDYVVPLAKDLLRIESNFHAKNAATMRIYRAVGVELSRARTAIAALERIGRGIARLNVIKAICDTFSSRLSKDRPMPGFVVDDADWDLKQKAHRYREFIVGQMLETEFDDLSRDALHDGTRLGWGWTRIDDDGDGLIAERIPFNDLLFDRRECKYGKPQNAVRIHRVARDHLAELYPDHEDWILNEAPASVRRASDDDSTSGPRLGDLDDYLDVFTAIHLPSTPESDRGRRVVVIEGATLSSEQWHEPRFPWSQFQLMKPDEGIYPDGFVDQLADLQHSVNKIVRDLQLNLTATGRGFFLQNEANKIPVEQMTAMQPFVMNYKGSQPPTWVAPSSVNPAQVSMLDKFIEEMFNMTGVSRASAESRSQLGPGASGVALDTQYDIDSDRFRMPQANYARYRLNGAQCYLDGAARVARRRQNAKGSKRSWVAVSWKGRDAIQRLDYDKVTLKEGTYRLRIEPVGFLPDTHAGKLSVVEQLAKAGVIPQWLVPVLMLDSPDLDEAKRIIVAPYKNCLRKMDELVDVDLPAPMPEQYNDLDLELKISIAFYNWVQSERAPAEIQTRFRTYCDLVIDAIKQREADKAQQQAAAAPAGAMAGGPAGMFPGASMPPPPPHPGSLSPLQPGPGGIPLMPQGPLPQPPMIGAIPAAA